MKKSLSPVQQSIYNMMKAGKLQKEIARELGVTLGCVGSQIARIYKKHGVHSANELFDNERDFMKITEVTVSYGETQSLNSYCNVKPSVTLKAVVEDGDSVYALTDALLQEAKSMVQAQVDIALEDDDMPTRYYVGPHYDVLISHRRKAVVIIDSGSRLPTDLPDFHNRSFFSNLRFHKAQEKAASVGDYSVFDCTDGDFSKLPPLPELAKDSIPF